MVNRYKCNSLDVSMHVRVQKKKYDLKFVDENTGIYSRCKYSSQTCVDASTGNVVDAKFVDARPCTPFIQLLEEEAASRKRVL